MSSSPSTTTIFGSCLCESITYTLTGPPLYTSICHCTNCRKLTGSLFTANSGYSKPQLSILSGHERLRTYHDRKTTSGSTLLRQFCGDCGSALFTVSEDRPTMRDVVAVCSGGFSDGGGLDGGPGGGVWEPQMECFRAERAAFLPEFGDGKVDVVRFEREVRFDGEGGLLREGA